MESLVPVESLPPCIGHQGLIYFSSGKNIKLSLREREREREREQQVAISVMLFVIVFKYWFANFVLAASSRLDHDWCYLVTLACSWFVSNKLRI